MKHLILTKGTKNGASVAVQNVDFIRAGITDSEILGGYAQMFYVDNRACDEAKIDVFSLEDQTKPVFTGTHRQLVEKLTKKTESFPKAVNDGTKSKEEIFNVALNDRCKYESSKTLDSDVYLAVMDAMDTYAQKTQSLMETLFQITYEMGFRKFYSGNTMADMMAAIEMAQRFEREHKDTDWDQEDWLSATSEFIEEEINKLKKEE